MGLEPTTYGLTVRRAANCATRDRGVITLDKGSETALGTPSRLEAGERVCARHGLVRFVRDSHGTRCSKCRSEQVARRRRRVKRILVREAGGCCARCGYDRYVGALQFHHLDPAEKSFHLGMGGLTRSLDAMRAEAAKCMLLCSNCHAEVEGGFVSLV